MPVNDHVKIQFETYLQQVIDCKMDEKQGLKIRTWYKNKVDEKGLRNGLKVK